MLLNSMKGYDPEGLLGPRRPLPDSVSIKDPPIDKIVLEPSSEQRDAVPVLPVVAAPEPPAYQPEAYGEAPVF
jgi:small subunit ribosomal protein S3e